MGIGLSSSALKDAVPAASDRVCSGSNKGIGSISPPELSNPKSGFSVVQICVLADLAAPHSLFSVHDRTEAARACQAHGQGAKRQEPTSVRHL